MYKIIGGDGKEYGPVSAEALRQWHAEGRVNGDTQVQMDGGAWQPMSAFPEFAALAVPTPAPAAPATPPPFPTAPAPAGPTPVPEGDYELDIGGCVSRGAEFYKNYFFLLFGAGLVYTVILILMWLLGGLSLTHIMGKAILGVLGQLPPSIYIFSIIGYLVGAPLAGGIRYLYLRAIRRDPASSVGDLFAGFSRAFSQLILGQLVTEGLAALCLIPAIIAYKFTVWPTMASSPLLQTLESGQTITPDQFMHLWSQYQQQLAQIPISQWGLFDGVLLLCMIPAMFLTVSWIFTLPLIIDRQMNFWPAMWTSWRRVNRHWWYVFGLYAVTILIAMAGFMGCCAGALFTFPFDFAAMMYAYETIFSKRDN